MEIGMVVESYVEDRANKGREYAKERLAQKWQLSCFDKQGLVNAVCDWEETSRRMVKREQFAYRVVMGIAVAAFTVNMAVVLLPRFSDSMRMFYCCFVAVAIVLFLRFIGYSRETAIKLHAEAAIAETMRVDVMELV